ncbi:FAD:protein FMN transferase [Candidatus Gracilibacteria bacterium 28_42_T64]|nr:FAD:protein FMN transferase [Candidatus Gracilibacteria bacterium 28_42_T64]
MQYSRKQFLMGTDINITIISDNNPLEDIYNAFGIFYSIEREFSRFSKDSDLFLLNTKKEGVVSNRFINVLELSMQTYRESAGFFNPLVNLKNIGYSSDFGKGIFEKKQEINDLDLEKVGISGNNVTLQENQNLDLGGIVKGYTVDLVSKYLKEIGYSNFIVNAGGDISLFGVNASGTNPVVAIDNPFNADEIFSTLEIKDKAVSTSGTYKRKWSIDDENFHHILTPESNDNNNEIVSITLIADSCYVCDAYATACIAMGTEKSLDFLKKKNIDGVIIGSDGNMYSTKGMSNYNLEII